jgi:hypothetical protein
LIGCISCASGIDMYKTVERFVMCLDFGKHRIDRIPRRKFSGLESAA